MEEGWLERKVSQGVLPEKSRLEALVPLLLKLDLVLSPVPTMSQQHLSSLQLLLYPSLQQQLQPPLLLLLNRRRKRIIFETSLVSPSLLCWVRSDSLCFILMNKDILEINYRRIRLYPLLWLWGMDGEVLLSWRTWTMRDTMSWVATRTFSHCRKKAPLMLMYYLQVVISPRNYFLFTPLLPSVTVGTLSSRSVLEPTRFLTRHLKRKVDVYEGEVTAIDPAKKTVKFIDNSEVKGEISGTEIEYDYLIYAGKYWTVCFLLLSVFLTWLCCVAGAENNTFGIKGVKENACFLKEIADAEKVSLKLITRLLRLTLLQLHRRSEANWWIA